MGTTVGTFYGFCRPQIKSVGKLTKGGFFCIVKGLVVPESCKTFYSHPSNLCVVSAVIPNAPLRKNVAYLIVGAALMLCAEGGVKEAIAGCGDYVLVNGQVYDHGKDRSPGQDAPLPLKVPCRGKNCSLIPHSPLLPSAPVSESLRVKEITRVREEENSQTDHESADIQRSASDALPLAVVLSGIFRPPRTLNSSFHCVPASIA